MTQEYVDTGYGPILDGTEHLDASWADLLSREPEPDESPVSTDRALADEAATDRIDRAAAARYARAVASLELSISAREEAQRNVAARKAGARPGPTSVNLADLLVEDIAEPKYRIEGLWPSHGKILMTAPKKSGKTTFVGNLIHSLADATPFLAAPDADAGWRLGQGFEVNDTGRGLFLLDFEMTRKMLQEWLAAHRIAKPDRVHLQLMRGRQWDPRDDAERARWATHLRDLDTGTLLIDPVGPVMHALGIEENSNTEVGNFLAAIDQLVAEAGVDDLVVAHHTGHEGERARGASGLLGWPDAIWQIVRGREDDDTGRYFMAEGRDVEVAETALSFDHATRRMWLGHGNRRTAPSIGRTERIAALVEEKPGITKRELRAAVIALGVGADRAGAAIDEAVSAEVVHVHSGPNRAQWHYPGSGCETCQQPLPSGSV